ncbi:hypothetical protein PQ455_02750 [Sphingomonas naphthae]|uniref:Uncharacterized protein n=1 Tax=Sphingomonas naphthae TaxID=1813468 RepID=A0ABY7TP48_9SPHN|nr:hypothetical protein [Sphingomonas naphthae]WCT74170.1 hypothetical protein PQ455_02750 [Sphingomonas naphthae]
MATNKHIGGEKLDLEALDQVVGGAGPGTSTQEDEQKKKMLVAAEMREEVPVFSAPGGQVVIPPPTIVVVPEAVLHDVQNTITTALFSLPTSSPTDAAKSMQTLVDNAAGKLRAAFPTLDAESATGMAWATAYKAVFEDHSAAGKPAAIVDAIKGSITSHAADISRGFAAEVGYTGNLKASLSSAADALAHSLKGASTAAAEEIKDKASLAFEKGLEAAKSTGIGKSVMAAFDDPKNIALWQQAYANAGYAIVSPSWATPVKFLANLMTEQSTAKAIGLGDFPSEVKQTARAMVNVFDNVEKAFVDIYASGFLIPLTFGFDVKGIINMGENAADLGKAIWAGDTKGMADAAQSLVTDMAIDLKDGMVKYYYELPTKAFNWTKDATIQLMDDLGATPYINQAAAATKDAFVDFGNAAKNGSINALNTLEDFAKNDIPGALNQIESLAKSGLNVAVSALEDVARAGVKGAVTALTEVLKVGTNPGAAIDALGRLIKDNAPGALAEVAKLGATVEGATWAIRKAAEQGSAAALDAVTNLAKTAAGNFQRIAVDAVKEAVINGVPGAIDKMANLVENDVKWVRDSVQDLIGKGGAQAQQVLDKVEQLYGKAAGATAIVEWAAKYAANEVGRSAISELESIAKKGGAYANQAIDSLAAAMRVGGKHADRAWDAVAGVAESGVAHAGKAVATMESFAKSGANYASQSFDSLKRIANSGGTYVNQAIDGLASVAKSGTNLANSAVDELKKLGKTSETALKALEGAANTVGGYATTAYNEAKKAAESIIDKLHPRNWWPF